MNLMMGNSYVRRIGRRRSYVFARRHVSIALRLTEFWVTNVAIVTTSFVHASHGIYAKYFCDFKFIKNCFSSLAHSTCMKTLTMIFGQKKNNVF